MVDYPQKSHRFDTLFSSADTDFPGVGYPSCSRELSRIALNRNDPNGYYRFLGIPPSASSQEIKKSVRAKYRQYHPDGWEPNSALFEKTHWIAGILLNPHSKYYYDSTPPGFQFRDKDTVVEGEQVEVPIPEVSLENDYYHYFAFEPEGFDPELSKRWYDLLVGVSPIFRYTGILKVVLTNDKQPFWIDSVGMFVIPRWWNPTSANAFALFSVLTEVPMYTSSQTL